MKTKISILITTICISATSFAQLSTPLSQFSGNQMFFNPGYAGIYEMFTMNLTYRKQWVGLPGTPEILNFNANTPIKNQRHSVGGVFQREIWGPITANFIYGNYAYKVYTQHGVLNFGLQAGLINQGINWDLFCEECVDDRNDPWFGVTTANTMFDANVGVFFLTPTYYVGLSAKHITAPKYDRMRLEDGGTEWYSQLAREFFFIAGYHYDFDNTWSVRPELITRFVENIPVSVNLGAHAYYLNDYSLGANVSTGMKAVTLTARAMLTHNLRIGYSYDMYWGDIGPQQRGSHEIMLNYYLRDLLWGTKNTERLIWN
jgi:type IX secretion system PorP/SprF family membrane protein